MLQGLFIHAIKKELDLLGLGETSNLSRVDKLKIVSTKSRLNSSVVTNVEPVSILFHKLHFIETRE